MFEDSRKTSTNLIRPLLRRLDCNSPALGCKLTPKLSILADRFRIQNWDRWFNLKISSRKLLGKQSGIETLEYAFERWLMATFRAKLIENIFDDIFLEYFSSFPLGSSKKAARATGNPSKTLKETETRSFVYLVSYNSSLVTENVLRKFNPAECASRSLLYNFFRSLASFEQSTQITGHFCLDNCSKCRVM